MFCLLIVSSLELDVTVGILGERVEGDEREWTKGKNYYYVLHSYRYTTNK